MIKYICKDCGKEFTENEITLWLGYNYDLVPYPAIQPVCPDCWSDNIVEEDDE